MSCTGCFNGCTEVTSTDCEKYTGVNIPELGIENGDSLTTIITKITDRILTIMTGAGIVPVVDVNIICKIVKDYLPVSGDITLNHYISALIQTACALDERINTLNQSVNQIDKAYDVCCLTGIDATSKTHEVLQATIKKVCAIDTALTAFILDVTTNYVQISELNGYIAEYLAAQNDNTYRNRLIPYAPVPYFGPLTNFDITGTGTGLFTDIYLCNGSNGTPDLRGVTLVGVTTGMQGGALNPIVDPAVGTGNPVYTINAINGTNTITLTTDQIPSHGHTSTSTATSDPHFHHLAKDGPRSDINSIYALDSASSPGIQVVSYELRGTPGAADLFRSSSTSVNVSVSTTVNAAGGGQAHSNVQPSKGCYYIMYIPS